MIKNYMNRADLKFRNILDNCSNYVKQNSYPFLTRFKKTVGTKLSGAVYALLPPLWHYKLKEGPTYQTKSHPWQMIIPHK